MNTYYRLGHKTTGTALPLHWCYTDPFEQDFDGDEVITVDNRAEGFQVWDKAARVVDVAARGIDADGTYPADEYPILLVVEASDTSDGCGEWLAVHPSDVVSVRAIEIAAVASWAREQAAAEYEIGDDCSEDEALEAWLQEHEAEVAAWLAQYARLVETTWVETLPEES